MAGTSAIVLHKNISTLSSKDVRQKQALQGSILAVAAAAAVIVSAPLSSKVHCLFDPASRRHVQTLPSRLPHKVGVADPISIAPKTNRMLQNRSAKPNHSS